MTGNSVIYGVFIISGGIKGHYWDFGNLPSLTENAGVESKLLNEGS